MIIFVLVCRLCSNVLTGSINVSLEEGGGWVGIDVDVKTAIIEVCCFQTLWLRQTINFVGFYKLVCIFFMLLFFFSVRSMVNINTIIYLAVIWCVTVKTKNIFCYCLYQKLNVFNKTYSTEGERFINRS